MESYTNTPLNHMGSDTINKKLLKRLKDTFGKNGFTYRIVYRDESVALIQTFTGDIPTGFEVVRIYTRDGREYITTNARFGFDGSKCFFRTQPRTARQYYEFLSNRLKENPNYKYIRK